MTTHLDTPTTQWNYHVHGIVWFEEVEIILNMLSWRYDKAIPSMTIIKKKV